MTAKKKAVEKKKSGVGAHGARGRPAGSSEAPKWRGGPPKGENEKPARKNG